MSKSLQELKLAVKIQLNSAVLRVTTVKQHRDIVMSVLQDRNASMAQTLHHQRTVLLVPIADWGRLLVLIVMQVMLFVLQYDLFRLSSY